MDETAEYDMRAALAEDTDAGAGSKPAQYQERLESLLSGSRVRRGVDPAAVASLVRDLTEDTIALARENVVLAQHNNSLRYRLAQEPQGIPPEALEIVARAEQSADEIVARAAAEASETVDRANVEASRVLAVANRQASSIKARAEVTSETRDLLQPVAPDSNPAEQLRNLRARKDALTAAAKDYARVAANAVTEYDACCEDLRAELEE